MNYKLLFSLAILAFPLSSYGMSTTFFKPATIIPKIRFANDAFFTITPLYAHSSTINSYDGNGQKTYLLNWNGPETLLNSYVDKTLPNSDITSAGKAYLDAKSITNEFGLIITKNFPKGFFFETQLFIKQLRLKNLRLIPLNSKNEPFESTDALASEDPTFAQYLDDFESLYFLPSIEHKDTETTMLTQNYTFFNSFIFAGYTNTWNHFSHIDFIDFTCKVGMALDFVNRKESYPILQLPLNTNNGFCAEISTAIGVLNWINIGTNFSTKVYTGTEQNIGLNTNSVDNDFLKPYQSQATVKPGPFFYSSIYVEADHIEGGLSMLLGYSFAQQQKTKIETTKNSERPPYLNNEQSRYQGWSLGTFLFEVEYDFATEKCKNVPSIKFSLYQPLHGRRVFKSATQVTSCCLQFSHKF
jgi:hypothetical protein